MIKNKLLSSCVAMIALALAACSGQAQLKELPSGITRVPVVFSGGYETDPRDGGRPVTLIASALGVSPEVFREAFSHVRPAPAGLGEPDPQLVRDNKTALMSALGKYGITNEKLDTVSNHYRYVRSRNELWPAKPASAFALVKDGVIIGYEIGNGGAGYSSPPLVSIQGMPNAQAGVELSFGEQLESNGAVSALMVLPDLAK